MSKLYETGLNRICELSIEYLENKYNCSCKLNENKTVLKMQFEYLNLFVCFDMDYITNNKLNSTGLINDLNDYLDSVIERIIKGKIYKDYI